MKAFQIISLSIFLCLIVSFDSTAQVPQPEEGKSLIVFYRKKKMSGGAIRFNIQDAQRTYGELKNGDVMYVNLDPGEHTFYSKVLTEDAITLFTEEDKVYYVKATIKVGYYAGRPRFERVDEKTALKEIK